MNGVTRDIMRIANVDVDTAIKIQNTIDEYGMLDYSECTDRQFRRAITEAIKIQNSK